jgi:hypothetical protein
MEYPFHQLRPSGDRLRPVSIGDEFLLDAGGFVDIEIPELCA